MADSPEIPDTESKRDYHKGRTLNPELPPCNRTALRARKLFWKYMQPLHQVPLHRISRALSRYASSECPDDRPNVITAALLQQHRASLKKFLVPRQENPPSLLLYATTCAYDNMAKSWPAIRALRFPFAVMNNDRGNEIIVFARRDRDADLPTDHRASVARLLFQ
jgi:hypothetical protein